MYMWLQTKLTTSQSLPHDFSSGIRTDTRLSANRDDTLLQFEAMLVFRDGVCVREGW